MNAFGNALPGGQNVDVILEGGPIDLPQAMRLRQASADDQKIKVMYLGGYEHFELADEPREGSSARLVFRWTMRTRIAE